MSTKQVVLLDAGTIMGTGRVFTRASQGVTLHVSPSSYDVPQSVTVVTDKGEIVLAFNYLDSEEEKDVPVDENLTFKVGKHSGKVLRILAKETIGTREAASKQIVRGVEAQLDHATRDNQKMNYTIIKDLLTHQLEPALSGR